MVPPLDEEASGITTGSEEILKAFSLKHSLNARVINYPIKDVLNYTEFNSDFEFFNKASMCVQCR